MEFFNIAILLHNSTRWFADRVAQQSLLLCTPPQARLQGLGEVTAFRVLRDTTRLIEAIHYRLGLAKVDGLQRVPHAIFHIFDGAAHVGHVRRVSSCFACVLDLRREERGTSEKTNRGERARVHVHAMARREGRREGRRDLYSKSAPAVSSCQRG